MGAKSLARIIQREKEAGGKPILPDDLITQLQYDILKEVGGKNPVYYHPLRAWTPKLTGLKTITRGRVFAPLLHNRYVELEERVSTRYKHPFFEVVITDKGRRAMERFKLYKRAGICKQHNKERRPIYWKDAQ